MKARFIVLALFVAAAVGLSGAAQSSAKADSPGPPDTYVASWDAIGQQAFSAAGLTPAEGHVIFAYVAIAVYDSVMAVEGGYEPFAVDVDAPDEHVCGGGSRRSGTPRPRVLPTGARGDDHRSGLRRIAGHDPGRPGEDERNGARRVGCGPAHRPAHG